MSTDIDFCRELVQDVPELKADFDEHERYYEEVLPHVFFGDVTAAVDVWAVIPDCQDVIRRILAKLELGLQGGDEDIDNLIQISFLEGYLGTPDVLAIIKPMMPPKLKQEMARQEAWSPDTP